MRPLAGLPGLAGATLVSPTNAPGLEALAASWAYVIVDRVPAGAGAVLGPMSLGYFGDVGARDRYTFDSRGTGLIVGTPFDYQAAWLPIPSGKGISRRVDMVPTEGFALGSIIVERYQTIIHASELTPVALDRTRRALIAAWDMRDHFVKHGQSVAVVPSL